MGKAVRIIAQIGVLALFQLAGARLATLAGVPIPGNVVGLLLLFLALQTGLLKLTLVQEGADFLLRHLVFFFIPVAVDLMNWGGVFRQHGFRLALVIGVGSVLTFLVTGHASQWLQRRGKPCKS
ncbi:MAG: CidA/LrgA family protein [Holophagaceae bacterium]